MKTNKHTYLRNYRSINLSRLNIRKNYTYRTRKKTKNPKHLTSNFFLNPFKRSIHRN